MNLTKVYLLGALFGTGLGICIGSLIMSFIPHR